MDARTLGGARLRSIEPGRPGRQDLAAGPYVYYRWLAEPGATLVVDDLGAATAYLLDCDDEAEVVLEQGPLLRRGDVVQAERTPIRLRVRGGRAEWLVAGTVAPSERPAGAIVLPREAVQRVEKPWGRELWLAGEHPGYALKHIWIRAGTRTSLQYHRQKQETNVLVGGCARFHYKRNDRVANEGVGPDDVAGTIVTPIASVDVPPGVLHRIEALTDVVLCEASTPHLSDVVRVSDDSRRPDGRIESEHRV
jgi:mannose-6-phosphate isomerase